VASSLVAWAFLVLTARGAGPVVSPIGTPTGFTTVDTNGYAATDVNSCAIDVNNLQTFTVGGSTYQFISYYNSSGEVMIGRRSPDASTWTTYDSGINDGSSLGDDHDVVAFSVDSSGTMHISWGMHNVPLNYDMSNASVMSSNLSSISFTNKASSVYANLGSSADVYVTYPAFYNIPNSNNLLFTYRSTTDGGGGSGDGDQYFSIYNPTTGTFTDEKVMQGQTSLHSGDTNYNAYLNRMQFSSTGALIATWTWRQTSNWQTNNNIVYGQSPDDGVTWDKQSGTQYTLPIVEAGSPSGAVGQVVWTLPENTSYINQSCMTLDDRDRPIVATYWAPGTTGTTNSTQAPNSTTNNPNRQYMLAYYNGTSWATTQITARTSDTAFDTGGGDVRDLSRPLVMVDKENRVIVVGRSEDTSMGSNTNPSLGLYKNNIVVYFNEDMMNNKSSTLNSADWKMVTLDAAQMGQSEMNFDQNLWNSGNLLDLFYEPTGMTGSTAAPVQLMQWNEQQFMQEYDATVNQTTNTFSPIKGDFNFDGKVTNADLQAMLNALKNPTSFETSNGLIYTSGPNIGQPDPADLLTLGDINNDGVFNAADILSMEELLATGTVGGPSTTAVPEPPAGELAALGFLICGVLFFGRRRLAQTERS
jgi:hypothetical protein